MITKEDVTWAYRLYLDREPENENIIELYLKNFFNRKELLESIKSSEEYKKKLSEDNIIQRSPFWHYYADFDAVETITKYAKKQINLSPSHITNFLGVKIRPDFIPSNLAGEVGSVGVTPIPANWHADIAEWASCLRSVDLSGDQFVMMELGCGWGCWMNNLGVAAKAVGKKIKLYGVEANQEHLQFAKLVLADNGITKNEHVLTHGIAGKKGAFALFPSIDSGIDWGGTAIFDPSSQQLAEAIDSKKYVVLPVVDISILIKDETKLDFLHVDIQGAELDLLTELFDLLCKKVRYVFIGTHSKQIEGGLFDLFMSNNVWKLEMERPAIFDLVNGLPVIKVDGVQAWRNYTFD